MPTNGATARSAVITSVAIIIRRAPSGAAAAIGVGVEFAMSALAPEEAGRLGHQHEHHDHEYHGVRSFGVEILGQSFDDAEPEAGQDGPHDRAHAADHD